MSENISAAADGVGVQINMTNESENVEEINQFNIPDRPVTVEEDIAQQIADEPVTQEDDITPEIDDTCEEPVVLDDVDDNHGATSTWFMLKSGLGYDYMEDFDFTKYSDCPHIDDALLRYGLQRQGKDLSNIDTNYCCYCNVQTSDGVEWQSHIAGYNHKQCQQMQDSWFLPTTAVYEDEMKKLQESRTVLIGPATLEDLADENIVQHVRKSASFRLHYDKSDERHSGYIELVFANEENAKECAQELSNVQSSLKACHLRSKAVWGKMQDLQSKVLLVRVPLQVTDGILQALFPTATSLRVANFLKTTMNKRNVFIEFDSVDDAIAAFEGFAERNIDEHNINVRYVDEGVAARNQTGGCFNCGDRSHIRNACPKGRVDFDDITGGLPLVPLPIKNMTKIRCVAGIPESMSQSDLKVAFPGAINITIPWSYKHRTPKRHAYIEFATEEETVCHGKVEVNGVFYNSYKLQPVAGIGALAEQINLARDQDNTGSRLLRYINMYRQYRQYCDTDYWISPEERNLFKQLSHGRKFLQNKLNKELRSARFAHSTKPPERHKERVIKRAAENGAMPRTSAKKRAMTHTSTQDNKDYLPNKESMGQRRSRMREEKAAGLAPGSLKDRRPRDSYRPRSGPSDPYDNLSASGIVERALEQVLSLTSDTHSGGSGTGFGYGSSHRQRGMQHSGYGMGSGMGHHADTRIQGYKEGYKEWRNGQGTGGGMGHNQGNYRGNRGRGGNAGSEGRGSRGYSTRMEWY